MNASSTALLLGPPEQTRSVVLLTHRGPSLPSGRGSISTAGRVLRQSTLPVAANVVERVRKAATELRYGPNVAAPSLRGAQPRIIGLMVGDMLNVYYGEIAEVVTQTAESSHGMLQMAPRAKAVRKFVGWRDGDLPCARRGHHSAGARSSWQFTKGRPTCNGPSTR